MAKQQATSKDTGEVRSGFRVIQEFRDIDNFDKAYAVGDDVSDLPEARLARLIELGLVEKNTPDAESEAAQANG